MRQSAHDEQARPRNERFGEIAPLSLTAMGALIGDPVRAAILVQLMDGSRRPAAELAFEAGASPQAASAHLAQLVDGGACSRSRASAAIAFSPSLRAKSPK